MRHATLASEVEPSVDPSPDAPRSRRRFTRLLLRALIGLALGASISEWVFRERDGGAFPLINVYAADRDCGVRLAANKTTTVAVAGGKPTTIHINGRGFRGREWPARADDDILIVGDSQSFGLGVEENETLGSWLADDLEKSGRRASVLDASVPTYGPIEYAITVARIEAERHPKKVIVALNLSNDFFELSEPNNLRHTVMNGWAVRTDAGLPKHSEGATSPFVTSAIQSSHLAFALWRAIRTSELLPDAGAHPKDFHDLVDSVTRSEQAPDLSAAQREARRQDAVTAARAELSAAQNELVLLARKYNSIAMQSSELGAEWQAYIDDQAVPRDHVFTLEFGGCEARGGTYKAHIAGSRTRRDVEAFMMELTGLPGITHAESQRFHEVLARRDNAEWALAAAEVLPPPLPNVQRAGPMVAWLSALHQQNPTTDLMVVAIPLDVQVSPDARIARGANDADVEALDRLMSDLKTSAEKLGVVVVDPTGELRPAGRSAYLIDGHLSAHGQAIVAGEVAKTL